MPSYDQWGRPVGAGGGSTSYDQWGRATHTASSKPTSAQLQKVADNLIHGSGGLTGFIENAGGDIAGTLLGIPSAAVHVGGQVAYDFGHTNRSLAQAWKDPHGLLGGVLRPIVESERQSWGPLFGYLHGGGDIHKFEHGLYQHPLGPALDVLTAATLGGSGALKGVQFADKSGRLAEGGKLAEAAKGERSVTFQPEGSKGITEPLRPGKTLQGRLLQNRLDRLGETRPNLPVIGASRKVSAITDKRAYNRATTSRIPVREFQATVKGLTNQERFALHVAAAGTPLPERISYFEDRLATEPSKALEAYVRRLKGLDPQILSAPSERMVRAVSQARDLEAAGGKTLIEIGKLTPATRAERKFLEQRIVSGAEYVPDLGSVEGGAPITELRTQEVARLSGAADTGISPELGPAFRTPHVVETERGTAGLFSTPKAPLGKPRMPGALKQNRGLRMATAQLATNPEIFGTDYLATTRYAHQLDLQKNVLDRVASELDPHLPGGKRPDEYYYRPQGPSQLPRDVREQDAIAQDAASQGVAQASADDVVFKHLPPSESTSIGVLNERGVRRVPARFATRYKSQFGGVSSFERHFLDRPLDVWRAFVLRARPAWLVNNLLGNSVLYALRYAGRGGAAALLTAIKMEHGDEPLIQIGKMIQIDKRMRSLGPVLEEVAPGLGQSSFFNSNAIRHSGVYSKDVPASAFQDAVSKGGVSMKVARKAVGKVANSITWLNTHTENMMREAAFLAEADRAGVIRNIQRQAKEFEGVNLSLKEALRRMDTKTAEDLTNRALRALGDFNSLSPFERRFIRKVIPFYSWYRVITTVIAHSVIDDPLRWRLLQIMAASAAEDPSSAVQLPVPSWLRGSVPLGPESGGTQSVLSTQSANPFSTIVQEGTVAKGLVSGKPKFGTESPLGFLNPFLSAGLAGVGVDPSFGGGYRGPGVNRGFVGRFVGQSGLSLPQVQLAQHVRGAQQSTLYPEQSSLDYLLNYLGVPVKRVNVREAEKRAKAGE